MSAVVAKVARDLAHEKFRRWLGTTYDTDSLDVVMAAAAVERLDGDPLWALVISGSGNAKTETVQALAGAGAWVESTISSEAALLSGSPKKDKAETATGGLLKKMGPSGVLVLKDVTSILSMHGEARASVLAALREIYDGFWTRNLGTDGGVTLSWSGRIAVVGAVTTAWDTHHAVIAAFGDRFVTIRTNSDEAAERKASGRQALMNIGSEVDMRKELSDSVGMVVRSIDKEAATLTEDETDKILDAANLVSRARTAVDRDFKGTPLVAHALEAPTRLAKQLGQVVRGGVAIGMERPEALRLAVRCARDSMPPTRLKILDHLAAFSLTDSGEMGLYTPMHEIRKAVDLPRTTVDRELQAMHLLKLVNVYEEETTYRGNPATRWSYRMADDMNPSALRIGP